MRGPSGGAAASGAAVAVFFAAVAAVTPVVSAAAGGVHFEVVVTLAVAAMLALTLQLDALDLLRRLALDDATRQALVIRAENGVEPTVPPADVRPCALLVRQDRGLR